MDYEQHLDSLFKHCRIKIHKHDTSFNGLPTYIEIELGKGYKDKGSLSKDYQNYLHRRFGLKFQTTPEYRGRGKTTTLRVFQTWDDVAELLPAIADKYSAKTIPHHLPVEFQWLYVQPSK